MNSLAVLRQNPELGTFPLVSSGAGLVYLGLLFGGGSLLGLPTRGAGYYGFLFVLYFGTTFIASFFTAGLVHETREAFEGREPSFERGLRAAWEHVWTLLAWATVSATIGVVLRFIRRRGKRSIASRVFTGLFSAAWTLLTYFVIPVIIFEDVGIVTAISRSGTTFKQTWGETTGAGFGVSLVIFLLTLGGGFFAAALYFLGIGSGSVFFSLGALIIGVVTVLAAYFGSITLGAIARTALYVYATEGQTPSEFEDVDLTRLS